MVALPPHWAVMPRGHGSTATTRCRARPNGLCQPYGHGLCRRTPERTTLVRALRSTVGIPRRFRTTPTWLTMPETLGRPADSPRLRSTPGPPRPTLVATGPHAMLGRLWTRTLHGVHDQPSAHCRVAGHEARAGGVRCTAVTRRKKTVPSARRSSFGIG